ncbi:hypothetical protein TOTORO_03420 [Serratia phage vB_SmaS-Totoro]|nr:hypothetical protein TOTORO_03420 [Serratia phage vB_SmaS-Totoro]
MGVQKYFIKPGDHIGRLTVVSFWGRDAGCNAKWNCRCDCGKMTIVVQRRLGTGKTQSCGCYAKDRAREANITHGMEGSRLYSIYWNMRNRCDSPKNKKYHRYGGRGVGYHPSFSTFEGFLAGIPEGYSDKMELDRIDNDGNYEPGNLRWITHRNQMRNMGRNVITEDPHTGEKLSNVEVSERYRVHTHSFYMRTRKRNMGVSESIEKGYVDSKVKIGGVSAAIYNAVKDDLWFMDIGDIADWHGIEIAEVWAIKNSDSYDSYSAS